jgi:hypothetical protein
LEKVLSIKPEEEAHKKIDALLGMASWTKIRRVNS